MNGKIVPPGMEICDTCGGKGEATFSCCTGDVITDDYQMCPQCKEHLGEETCDDCGGTGLVKEGDQAVRNRVDMQMMAEDRYDAWRRDEL